MTVNERTLEFLVVWQVKGLDLSPGALLEVGPYGENLTRIKLWSKKDKKGQRLPDAKDELRIYFLHRVSNDALQRLSELEAMIAPILDDGIISCLSSKEDHDASLKSHITHPESPSCLYELKDTLEEIGKKEAIRFISYIRYRCVYDWDYSLPGTWSISWRSKSDNGWRQLITFRIGGMQVIDTFRIKSLEPEFIQEIEEYMPSERQLFFAYDLVCEATRLANTLPSLSLFEAYQAMEVGTKEAIVRLQPQTEWLMFHMPSPPVEKLLRDYLSTLVDAARADKLRAFLTENKAVFLKVNLLRNELTHQGKPIDKENAKEACSLAGKLVYLLEYLSGSDWAKDAVWGHHTTITSPENGVLRIKMLPGNE